ncbi:hypothetical protein [Sphingomonas echinoides]|uniref:hypothetical protein n=1 Tax=Sphingomonas echinoides TaxID=59803 RepID=UPI002412F36C|nr:hypothetical protein [Sphingomonas echinoides]
MEYWIVYSLDNFEEMYRSQGNVGASAYQQVPKGAGLLVVPFSVIGANGAINIEALRAAMNDFVDASAEAFCLRFLTPGTTQAMRYLRKETEARAWLLDNTTRTPFLEAEASACDVTVEELVPVVIQRADQWEVVGALIEGERMGAKAKIAQGETFADIVKVGRIDWQALLAPPAPAPAPTA